MVLTAINDDVTRTLLPAMVCLGLLAVLGAVGNTLVCYVFCRRFRASTQNILIVCLAAIDLVSCCISIPTEIVDMHHTYTYTSAVGCKVAR